MQPFHVLVWKDCRVLLATLYTLAPASSIRPNTDLPLEVDLDDAAHARLVETDDGLRLELRRPVDNRRLEVVAGPSQRRHSAQTESTAWYLRLRDDDSPEHVLARDFTSAISFLTTEPVSLGRVIGGDRFLPENEEDVTLLEQLGTDAAFQGISLTFSIKTFAARITAQNIEAVLPRRTGMRIYADALRTSFSCGTVP